MSHRTGHPYRDGEPAMQLLDVGALRTRKSDGVIVEIVAVNTDTGEVCVVPYHVMKGHKRHSDEAREHPERAVACPAEDFRDVTEEDLRVSA